MLFLLYPCPFRGLLVCFLPKQITQCRAGHIQGSPVGVGGGFRVLHRRVIGLIDALRDAMLQVAVPECQFPVELVGDGHFLAHLAITPLAPGIGMGAELGYLCFPVGRLRIDRAPIRSCSAARAMPSR
jgi:hypothetical protein